MSDPVAEAQELLVDTIDTFEKLEVVRLLARTAPRPLDALIAELGVSLDVARETMRELTATKVVHEQAGGWVIDPAGQRYAAVLALVALYDADRIGVLNRMTKISLARIRASAARTFADAFVVRTRKKAEGER